MDPAQLASGMANNATGEATNAAAIAVNTAAIAVLQSHAVLPAFDATMDTYTLKVHVANGVATLVFSA